MDWTTPFVVYRIKEDATLEEVYYAQDIKKAKYWLSYIAQPGDVCCRTPLHPKHSQSGKQPEYWSHKMISGTASSKKEEWEEYAKEKNFDLCFPETQMGHVE